MYSKSFRHFSEFQPQKYVKFLNSSMFLSVLTKQNNPCWQEMDILRNKIGPKPPANKISSLLGLITITYVLTSSHKAAPSLGCKVVVYSVNYNFCLNQISLNQFWNRISIISISYSCTSMWLQKEFTLLHGQFLTVRCEHYQICVKKSWSEFN